MRPLALLIGSVFALATSPSFAGLCENLSYERNSVYKSAGYCFKTAAQIRNFGNAGCQYDNADDVPLSARDRAHIDDIVRQERAAGCR